MNDDPAPLETTLSLRLLPSGHLKLCLEEAPEALALEHASKIRVFFEVNDAIGLLRLGLTPWDRPLPPNLAFWQQFAQLFIAELCKQTVFEQNIGSSLEIAPPTEAINTLIDEAPLMPGIQYLTQETLYALWQRLIPALLQELKPFGGKLDDYLAAYHSTWNTVGKVCFHLAENKANAERPFAFLATYTHGVSQASEAQHLPLGRALEAFAHQKPLLLALLVPVQRASENSAFLKALVETGSIFQALAWEPNQAYQFLKDLPLFEAAGIKVRVPNWWNPKKLSRPSMTISIGNQAPSTVGLGAMLDFNIAFTLPSGEALSAKEFEQLRLTQSALVQIKGQWVHVDSDKLNAVLNHWKTIEKQFKQEGLSFAEGLRLVAGLSPLKKDSLSAQDLEGWSTSVAGDYLQSVLDKLRHPASSEKNLSLLLRKHLQASLRPYQEKGVQWLVSLYTLGLGGCLADDMGLGKTIQIIALLLCLKHQKDRTEAKTHLLVAPASLLDNWKAEINRFAPSLQIWIAHPSVQETKVPLQITPPLLNIDLVMTTYSMVHRLSWLKKEPWDILILDEAQALKNPLSKQTRAIKELPSRVKFALTGTPIENRLADLWSLFDCVAPGLLGNIKAFSSYSKQKAEASSKGHFLSAVRRLVSPYILRRLKTDKSIISDLPDKTEIQSYCTLSKQQIGLYQHAVHELQTKLEQQKEGIQRSGLVLSYLMRFKQICNHPHQWLGHGHYDPELSGKFIRLKELCLTIAEAQEKVLIFTQFREIIPALSAFLTSLFECEGLSLHGQTPVKERAKRVQAFQAEDGPPFFVLSLKAGGTGLNLTAASHVIHFDRWWNPAVENQATDRAYRIGQKRNVLVHKFICKGTIEEKIDALISAKKSLSEEIIGSANELVFSELSDEALLSIVKLDIHRALGEEANE